MRTDFFFPDFFTVSMYIYDKLVSCDAYKLALCKARLDLCLKWGSAGICNTDINIQTVLSIYFSLI